MTTLSPFGAIKMDVVNVDDKMEVGTSPVPHTEDIDFDLDPVREQSMDRSMADEGEAADFNDTENLTELYANDDDMIEDGMLQDQYNGEAADTSMETYNQHDASLQDEEILYDYEGTGSHGLVNAQDGELEHLEIEPFEELAKIPEHAANQSEKQDGDDQPEGTIELDPIASVSVIPNGASDNEVTQSTMDELRTDEQDDLLADTKAVDFAVEETAAGDTKGRHTQDIIAPTSESASTALAEEQLTSDNDHHVGIDSQQDSRLDQEVQNQPSAQPESATTQTLASESLTVNEPTLTAEAASPLHPVTISYLGQDMSLFPPMVSDTSATFFLSDATLAYEPFEKLLVACRDILGDSLEHDDELVFDIPALGLHICEDSKYASQLNLSQVIDVFLLLSQNENTDNLEPIYCNLTSRVCLASQYAYLLSSAQEGKTYTEITAENLDSPDIDESSYQELSAGGATDGDVTEDNHGTDVIVNAAADAIVESEGVRENSTYTHDELDTPSHVPLGESEETDDHAVATEIRKHAELPEAPESNKDTQPYQGQPHDLNIETQDENEHIDDAQDWPEITDSEAQALDADEHYEEIAAQHDDASNSSHTLGNESPNRLDNANDVDDALGHLEDHIEPEGHEHERAETDTYNLQNEASHEHEDHTSFDAQGDEIVANLVEADAVTGLGNEDVDEHEYFDENDETVDHNSTPEGLHDKDQSSNTDGHDHSAIVNESASLDADRSDLEVPITPSKQNGSKRKVLEEEEDLDFLDFSTPEPKRTRAS